MLTFSSCYRFGLAIVLVPSTARRKELSVHASETAR